MKTYMVDVTLEISAHSQEDAWFMANAFCEASLRSPDSPDGIQVESVSEPEVVE
jgi:hypothetical protein